LQAQPSSVLIKILSFHALAHDNLLKASPSYHRLTAHTEVSYNSPDGLCKPPTISKGPTCRATCSRVFRKRLVPVDIARRATAGVLSRNKAKSAGTMVGNCSQDLRPTASIILSKYTKANCHFTGKPLDLLVLFCFVFWCFLVVFTNSSFLSSFHYLLSHSGFCWMCENT
jgi:hypothetical protein